MEELKETLVKYFWLNTENSVLDLLPLWLVLPLTTMDKPSQAQYKVVSFPT